VTPFRAVRSFNELQSIGDAELPGILKTNAWGYDGRGQFSIASRADLESAWTAMDGAESVLERFVDFELELSVVAARGRDDECVFYGPIVNTHRNHILDLSVTPSDLPQRICDEAIEMTRVILKELDLTGVLCAEFFLTRDGRLLVNELAPRPHNSGHLTVDAHMTCQFEQQVRAVCGLPLGSANQLRPAAMVNLLGDLWVQGTPNWKTALEVDEIKMHLYGKGDARSGRKMGHLTALAESPQIAADRVLAARRALVGQIVSSL
jgi:5-(carboxyamino)imidazole ribonucleotide synthase